MEADISEAPSRSAKPAPMVAPLATAAAEIMQQPVFMWPGLWLLLQSNAPLATQLDLRDRYNVPSYVPVFEAHDNTRKRWEERLLFPGYVCARAPEDTDVSWLRVRFVWGAVVVEPGMQKQLTGELAAVQTMLSHNPRIKRAEGLLPGNRVRITSGPLTGIEGRIARVDLNDFFVLDVSILGCSLMENVRPDWLEPV